MKIETKLTLVTARLLIENRLLQWRTGAFSIELHNDIVNPITQKGYLMIFSLRYLY